MTDRAKYQKERRELLKAKGLCLWCMGPTDNRVGCEKCRKRNSDRACEWHKKNYEAVLDHYGSKCACCGLDDRRFLSIDHINNDGYIKRKTGEDVTGPRQYARIVKRGFPKDLQLLCFNCNLAKNRFGGICPHELDRCKSLIL
jgi:hypothetical protein